MAWAGPPPPPPRLRLLLLPQSTQAHRTRRKEFLEEEEEEKAKTNNTSDAALSLAVGPGAADLPACGARPRWTNGKPVASTTHPPTPLLIAAQVATERNREGGHKPAAREASASREHISPAFDFRPSNPPPPPSTLPHARRSLHERRAPAILIPVLPRSGAGGPCR